jgi:hypothetical protein
VRREKSSVFDLHCAVAVHGFHVLSHRAVSG